jgi:hypothetical protein
MVIESLESIAALWAEILDMISGAEGGGGEEAYENHRGTL